MFSNLYAILYHKRRGKRLETRYRTTQQRYRSWVKRNMELYQKQWGSAAPLS